jgi:hypothetical protein
MIFVCFAPFVVVRRDRQSRDELSVVSVVIVVTRRGVLSATNDLRGFAPSWLKRLL